MGFTLSDRDMYLASVKVLYRNTQHHSPTFCSHVCGELIQSLVEIVHLHKDAHDDDNGKTVRGRVRELVVAVERKLERDAKALDAHDGDGADQAADGDVDKWRAFAVLWDHAPDHKHSKSRHKETVREERWGGQKRQPVSAHGSGSTVSRSAFALCLRTQLYRIIEDFIHSFDLLVLWRIHDDNDSADQAECTPNTPQPTQLFLQDEGGQNRTNQDTECAQGCDQDRRRKGVGGKVGHLADDHGRHAGPPDRVAQICVPV